VIDKHLIPLGSRATKCQTIMSAAIVRNIPLLAVLALKHLLCGEGRCSCQQLIRHTSERVFSRHRLRWAHHRQAEWSQGWCRGSRVFRFNVNPRLPHHADTRTRKGSATPTPLAMLANLTSNVRVISCPEGTKRIPFGLTRSSSSTIPSAKSFNRIWRMTDP
jgi:hypothetical protein